MAGHTAYDAPARGVYAQALRAITDLDSTIAGVRAEWRTHKRCVSKSGITCPEWRKASAELDKLLDRRLLLMATRDLETIWIKSDGHKQLSL